MEKGTLVGQKDGPERLLEAILLSLLAKRQTAPVVKIQCTATKVLLSASQMRLVRLPVYRVLAARVTPGLSVAAWVVAL